ncbi:hypothetical protein NQ318_019813 [Aromia moschata]|uniref:Uncharacterized protein n=1 Tax=Aromia moschata TaxID=1265417 RepID=A0AAV8YMV6_9CUCU|nr:hypothetical protein NQ318_019813 [Aromia moschata]
MEPLVNGMYDTELEYEICNPDKPIICGICGKDHSPKECNILKVTHQIPDKVIPSRARLTLPEALEIRKLADCSHNIYAKRPIERGTQFGPFQAKKLFTLHPSIEFPLKVFTDGDEDLSEYFLDTSDENECSWMIFVGPAASFEEQNVICYQEGEHLYYGTIKDILPGEPLKVWYSPYYATRMKKEILAVNNCTESETQPATIDVDAILKRTKNITPRDSWSCKFCGKVEKEISVFALHLLEHYRAQLSRVCTICKESFLSRRHLNKHLRFVHGNTPKKSAETTKDPQVPAPKQKERESKETTSVGGPLLLNDIIPDSLDNSSLFLPQTDISQFDLSSIDNQNILLESDNLNLNMDNILTENVKGLEPFNFEINVPETGQLVCDVCLKSFVKLRSLIMHIEQHTGKFLCYGCNRVFARKENMVHHACNSFYKVKCPLCERIFFQKKYLTQHMKLFHEKRFTCANCQTFFNSESKFEGHSCPRAPSNKRGGVPVHLVPQGKKGLAEHLARHKKKDASKDSRYVCAVCNTTLSCMGTYLRHARLHEGNVSHPCDLCGKVFARSDTLAVHKKDVHSSKDKEEACDVCSKTFRSRKLLNAHMETHRADKPHKCPVCQAAFKQRSNLTRHIRRHRPPHERLESLFRDDVEVYQCPKCDRNMKLKSSLRRHMRIFHPEDDLTHEAMRPRVGRLGAKAPPEGHESDESVMDLKQTIENMDFNTDEVNNCGENNDINMEIDKLLDNAENIDGFLNESGDKIVESLISIAAKQNHLSSVGCQYVTKEVCLSMPDLNGGDQDKVT